MYVSAGSSKVIIDIKNEKLVLLSHTSSILWNESNMLDLTFKSETINFR